FALIGTIPVGAVVLVQKARIAALAASLAKLSMIDPLTGLCNRRELFARLGCASTTDGLAFAFFDIDHFKLINDRFGHQAGDLVLTGFSGLLRAQAPEDALLVRLGGEEFGVLFSSGSPERARLFAERMVTLARITPFDTPAGQLFITVSGGVSFGSASMSADDLVGSADSALYRAKSTGRDRICEAEI
ncbi:MAG: GGDEF domain-containing protein, partial [Thermoleophilia bacterium]|nr:GGDEF domain-containing protein [Thermoleophilia bacterium]